MTVSSSPFGTITGIRGSSVGASFASLSGARNERILGVATSGHQRGALMRPAVLSRIAAIAGIFLLSASFSACDRHAIGANGPSAISFFGAPSSFIGTAVQPSVLSFERLSVFSCPLIPPFTTSLALSVTSPVNTDISLSEVSFQFVGVDGASGVPLQFFGNDLVGLFGSTVILGGTSRVFGFTPRFGCSIVSPRSLVMRAVFVDGFGSHPSTLSVPFN